MKILHPNYPTSTDYALLYELAQTQRIVCFLQHRNNPTKDVALTQARVDKDGSLEIGVRGISYVAGMDFDGRTAKEDFIAQCKAVDLEFIVPPPIRDDSEEHF